MGHLHSGPQGVASWQEKFLPNEQMVLSPAGALRLRDFREILLLGAKGSPIFELAFLLAAHGIP
jgi:hypothetical protein